MELEPLMTRNISDRMQDLVNKASDLISKAYENMEEGKYSESVKGFEKGLMVLDGLYQIKELKEIQVSSYRTVTPFQLVSDLQQCYLNLKMTKEAVDLMDRYPSIYKNKRNMLLIKSHIYALNRDLKREMKCYKELIKLDKKDIKVYIKIARSIKENHPKDKKEVRDILDRSRKYLKKDPSMAPDLAAAYRTLLDDLETAISILDKTRDAIKVASHGYWLERGEIYLVRDEVDLAYGAFEHALEERPEDVPTMVRMIEVYQRLGDYEKARDLCEKGLKLDPSDPGMLDKYRDLMGDRSISVVKNMDNNQM